MKALDSRLHDVFQAEIFKSSITRRLHVQWEYRDLGGELHAGVASSEQAARRQAQDYGFDAGRSVVIPTGRG